MSPRLFQVALQGSPTLLVFQHVLQIQHVAETHPELVDSRLKVGGSANLGWLFV